jgi:hypothetical protein
MSVTGLCLGCGSLWQSIVWVQQTWLYSWHIFYQQNCVLDLMGEDMQACSCCCIFYCSIWHNFVWVQQTWMYSWHFLSTELCFKIWWGKICRIVVAVVFTVPFILPLILCCYVVFFGFTAVFRQDADIVRQSLSNLKNCVVGKSMTLWKLGI